MACLASLVLIAHYLYFVHTFAGWVRFIARTPIPNVSKNSVVYLAFKIIGDGFTLLTIFPPNSVALKSADVILSSLPLSTEPR